MRDVPNEKLWSEWKQTMLFISTAGWIDGIGNMERTGNSDNVYFCWNAFCTRTLFVSSRPKIFLCNTSNDEAPLSQKTFDASPLHPGEKGSMYVPLVWRKEDPIISVHLLCEKLAGNVILSDNHRISNWIYPQAPHHSAVSSRIVWSHSRNQKISILSNAGDIELLQTVAS